MNINPQSSRINLINFNINSAKMIREFFHPNHFVAYQSDTKKNFEKNLESQPQDWYYRTHDVRYTMNRQYYRCKPFNNINWTRSIVIFGCSNVFGDAIDDDDTVSARLQELVGCHVVNLGVPGSCQQTSLYNMTILKNNNIKPRAVIHIWTDSMRLFQIDNKFKRCNAGHWNNWGMDPTFEFDPFANQKTHLVSTMFNRMVANNIYNDIPVIHATNFKTMHEEQQEQYPNMPMLYLPPIDNARDLRHPGIETNKNSAKLLHEELLKYGMSGETRTLNPEGGRF
jgi:hypothetical protein